MATHLPNNEWNIFKNGGPARMVIKHNRENAGDTENILESITDAVFTVNAKWQFTHINKQCEYYLKKDKRTLLGKMLWKAFPNVKEMKFYTECRRAVAEQVNVQFEEYYPPLKMWLSIKAYPANGGLTVYFLDITKHKKTPDQITNAYQNNRFAGNDINDISWSVDKKGNIISANDAFWKRFSLARNTKVDPALNNKILFNIWRQYYQKALTGKKYKITLTGIGNTESWHEEVSFDPIYSIGGGIIGVNCFSTDVTEQYRHLNDKVQQNDQRKKTEWPDPDELYSTVTTIMGLVPLYNTTVPSNLKCMCHYLADCR